MRSLLLFAVALVSIPASAVRAQDAAPAPTHLVPVVFKLDDVRTNASGYLSERWRKLLPLVQERKIKLSLGVIADSLENPKPDYLAWLKAMQATGLVEFWFHGYDHGVRPHGEKEVAEFTARSFEEQEAIFAKSQRLAQQTLGFAFKTFGPPGGGNQQASESDLDATARVLDEDPAMKVWLYPKPMDARGQRLTDAGKVTVLDRVWAVNIEQPLFLPNSEKFIAGYNQHAAKRRYFVIQGHPNKWDDARWAEFLKIVDYVTQNKIPTVLPSELAASLHPQS